MHAIHKAHRVARHLPPGTCAAVEAAAPPPPPPAAAAAAAGAGGAAGGVAVLPPPLLLPNATVSAAAGAAGGGGAQSTCLHGAALRGALLTSRGFAPLQGRKPGLAAATNGSWARLSVPVPEAAAAGPKPSAGGGGAWAHVGYLQSWRAHMGAATLRCEAPCTCGPEERVTLQGHDPAERVSVTKIVAVRLSRPAASAAASCVLRVDVVAGGAGGTRFVLSDLITGSAEPGPLTWAFDVAGQLLLH